MDNRNDQATGGQQNQPQNTGNERVPAVNEENPQDGNQWDNYQTRELSDEGNKKMEQSDLLSADEAAKQKPQHRD